MSDTGRPPLRSYGRRKGHTLSPRQHALVAQLLPRVRLDLARQAATPAAVAGLFGDEVHEVWLEIGFGGAEHLVWQAAANPAVGIIGAEPFLNGVVKLLDQTEARGLGNVAIHHGDAREVLAWLPGRSITRAFVLFPDPWPKLRHRKRRIVSGDLVAELARVLVPGGGLRLATDIGDYANQMLQVVEGSGLFHWQAQRADDWRTRPPDWPPTRYEAKAIGEGRRPVFLSFRRL